MFVQNVIKTVYDWALKSLNIKDVEFCNIITEEKTQLNLLKSNQSFENILCTQFTIVHIIQTKSVT